MSLYRLVSPPGRILNAVNQVMHAPVIAPLLLAVYWTVMLLLSALMAPLALIDGITKAWADALTVGVLIFYLGVLLYGGLSSTAYALEYGERSYSAWRPYMAPIKITMCVAVVLMLLQAFALLIRDIATLRGEAVE